MTYQTDCTLPSEWLAQIADEGLGCLPELIRELINTAMQIERQQHIGVGPYERSAERKGHANGYKPKRVTTRMGEITFAVPQVREGDFYPQALEKGLRSERALKVALAEMYVQGVSTRKVAKITEKLCGRQVSSTQVSQAAAQLDTILAQWRNRPLGACIYLFLDARYEKVRIDGQVRDVAVLIASAVNVEGKRQILGVSVSLSEREVHWRTFLQSLVDRGLCGLHLIISDAHPGLKQARQAVFGSIPWQRCQFHLQQNAQAYVPRQDMKAEVAADIRAIFNAPNRIEADALLAKTLQRYAIRHSKLADWMEATLPEGLTVFDFPESHRRLIRTTNGLERLNREIKRRTRIVGIFPNENACLRLVTAIVMEFSDEWETGKAYISLSPSC
ncbi:MAG: IS256 family transposase [Caldilineaceae bacterium]|nr:IS256 family transposase [Caldilineaceae bacterium]MCB1718338.1 IS256 family transposase [Candidatus Competibacteraceae bacterium]